MQMPEFPPSMVQAMFGEYARHVGAWLYVQNQGNGGVSFVGASRDRSLLYDSSKTHIFTLGEIIVRPHFSVASDSCKGSGLTGLVTNNHQEFISAEDREIICDPMGKLRKIGW